MIVRAFLPNEVDILQKLTAMDNLYRSMSTDEDNHLKQMHAFKDVMKKLRSKNVMHVQIANGLTEDVTPSIRKTLIDNTNKSFNAVNDKYKGIVEQKKHRADELGEARIRMFKMLGDILKYQHGLSVDDLNMYLVEKPSVEAKRHKSEFDVDIKKAVEAAKNE